MRKLIHSLLIALTIVSAYGLYKHYTAKTKKPDLSTILLNLPVQRLEKELFKLTNQEAIKHFLAEHPTFSQQFLGVHAEQDASLMVDKLYNLVQDTAMQELYQEVNKVFEEFTPIQQQLEKAFRYIRYYYPNYSPPQVATFITGMQSDLYVDTDLIVIGLDCFLGDKARFRPIKTPQYILRTYQPAYIAPKIMLLLAQFFQKNAPTDHTLLSDMLAYGKAYYFTKAVLPEIGDEIILGYTTEQLADTQQNQRIVWEHFIEHQLLYETNHLIKKRYLGLRPFTPEIGTKCPGNIGGWLGWEIIKQYMERNPQVTLAALMQETDAQKVLNQSKYRPRK